MTDSAQKPSSHGPSARLDSLVDQAQDLMGQLSAVSNGQGMAIESGDIAKVVEIVTIREPIVRGLVNVGEEIGAFIQDPKMISKMSQRDQDGALKRIALIELAMKRLREQDAKDQGLMEAARDAMANELASMGTNQSALRAYSGRSATPNPILQDRQG